MGINPLDRVTWSVKKLRRGSLSPPRLFPTALQVQAHCYACVGIQDIRASENRSDGCSLCSLPVRLGPYWHTYRVTSIWYFFMQLLSIYNLTVLLFYFSCISTLNWQMILKWVNLKLHVFQNWINDEANSIILCPGTVGDVYSGWVKLCIICACVSLDSTRNPISVQTIKVVRPRLLCDLVATEKKNTEQMNE